MPEMNPLRRAFNTDVGRDRGIIAQSNMRSAAISQLLSAVWAAAGIILVFILAKPDVRVTQWSAFFGVMSIFIFVVQLLAKAAILWPRGLDNLPQDANEEAYRRRIAGIAEEIGQNPDVPTEAEYVEGYLLQSIRATKERFTRITLIAVGVFLPFFILFIVTLRY